MRPSDPQYSGVRRVQLPVRRAWPRRLARARPRRVCARIFGEAAELLGCERFRTQLRVDAAGFDVLAAQQALQTVAQGLAAVGEGGSRQPCAARRRSPMAKRGSRPAAGARSRTTPCGGGWKAPGPDIEQRLDLGIGGEHDGQAPVILASGRGRHAIHDFLLQHEMHVRDRAALAQQMEQHGRRDIVGQVADDAQPARRPRRR